MSSLRRLGPGLAALALWVAAFALACRLLDRSAEATGAEESFWGRALGSGRTALSRSLYDQADVYFHGGVRNVEDRAFRGPFERWAEALNPVQHVHPEGAGVYELLPWYQFATQTDPHNVEAWLNAAFVAGGLGRRPDVAHQILREALRRNPRDYRLYSERGHLCLRERNYAQAAAALGVGLRLWPSAQPTDDDAQRGRLRLLSFSAYAYEILGERAQALAALRQQQALAPDNERLGRRLAALERGEDTRASARRELEAILAQPVACEREDAAHAHPDGDGGAPHEHAE